MRRLSAMALLAVMLTSCATISSRYQNPDGSVNAKVIISDASYGFAAGCESQWVSPADCALGADALNVAANIANQTGPGIAIAVRQSLVTFEARLAPDNHIRPYLDWVIRLLPSA